MSVDPNTIEAGTEFHSKVPPTGPSTRKGHAPGVKVGNDAAPEAHAQTFPPGTAPPEDSFRPNADSAGTVPTDASATLVGATSKDVHAGMGVPASGQTATELRGRGKKERSGLEGVGANASDPISEMGFDRDHNKGRREKETAMNVEQTASEGS